jgi:alpha-glucosidase (family GH31 glycosyl hydrolase)
MKAFHWCDFVFDSQMFPDPKSQIARLKESGESLIIFYSFANQY